MNIKVFILLLCTLFVFVSCKKEKTEEPIPDSYELRLIDPGQPLIAGSVIFLEFVLLHNGKALTSSEYYSKQYIDRLRVESLPGYAIQYSLGFDKEKTGLRIMVPVLKGECKLVLDLYQGNTIVRSASLMLNISLPEQGWIPKNILTPTDVCQAKNGKTYLVNQDGVWQSDTGLQEFIYKGPGTGYGRLWGAGKENIYMLAWDNGLAVSKDEGATFNPISLYLEGKVDFVTVLEDDRVLLSTVDSALISEDDGTTWSPFGVKGRISKVCQLADGSLISARKGQQFISELFYSTTAASVPGLLTIPQGTVDVEVAGHLIFALTKDGLYRSADKGKSFQQLPFAKSKWCEKILTDGTHLIIITNETVYITRSLESMEMMQEINVPYNTINMRLLSGRKLAAYLGGDYLQVLNY